MKFSFDNHCITEFPPVHTDPPVIVPVQTDPREIVTDDIKDYQLSESTIGSTFCCCCFKIYYTLLLVTVL